MTYCRLLTAIILDITYGINVSGMYDEYVTLAEDAVFSATISNALGEFWVEHFPFLRHLPSWVPGARFRRFAEHYKPIIAKLRDQPFAKIQKEIVSRSHLLH